MTFRFTSALILTVMCLSPRAWAQSGLLSVDEITSVVTGHWAVDPTEDENTETNCETDYVEIWIAEENGSDIYYSKSSGSDRVYRSAIRLITAENGDYFPAIILQYDNEDRLTESGDPVQWGLLMPNADNFYWVRLDIGFGKRTPMRYRCPETSQIG